MIDCKIAGEITTGDSVRFISSSAAPSMLKKGKFGPIIWFELGKPTTVHVIELPHTMTKAEARRYLAQHDDFSDPIVRNYLKRTADTGMMEEPVAAAANSAGMAIWIRPSGKFRLWQSDEILCEVNCEPVLASWDAKDHPRQTKLRAYLDDVMKQIGERLPAKPLSLDITVAVEKDLLRGRDLENYLTPLAKKLGHERFVHATATKRVGGRSKIRLAVARESNGSTLEEWSHFSCQVQGTSLDSNWKEKIQRLLQHAQPKPLPDGGVEVHLAWRCPPKRDWLALWKPTGDTMAPVLGQRVQTKRFDPQDDRIVCLHLHVTRDSTAKKDVDVGMWWRSADETVSS